MAVFPGPANMVTDRTITLNGSAQTAISAVNNYRTGLLIAAPQASALTYSFTNATPAAGGAGCFTLAQATSILYPAGTVPNGKLYVIGTNAAVAPIMEMSYG